MPGRLQSPGPVLLPLLAHWVTTRVEPGENPVAITCTFAGEFNPCDGVTVRCWAPAAAEVALGAAVVVGCEPDPLLLLPPHAAKLNAPATPNITIADRLLIAIT